MKFVNQSLVNKQTTELLKILATCEHFTKNLASFLTTWQEKFQRVNLPFMVAYLRLGLKVMVAYSRVKDTVKYFHVSSVRTRHVKSECKKVLCLLNNLLIHLMLGLLSIFKQCVTVLIFRPVLLPVKT